MPKIKKILLVSGIIISLMLFMIIIYYSNSKGKKSVFKNVTPDNLNMNTSENRTSGKNTALPLGVYINQNIIQVLNNPSVVSTQELVEYDGNIENIFFHPLLAYPEKSLDNKGKISSGIAEDFVTVSEFVRILDELYKNDYILVDIKSTYDQKTQNNKSMFKRKKLMLPRNKKPFVLSIDDLNYYDYMQKKGTVNKLVIDNNQNIGTLNITNDGSHQIKYDNEIIPIIESFISKHPDFSFNNARGIIALTGFHGVLGYRTDLLDSPQYQTEKQGAILVIEKLNKLGWKFASHSYTHSYTSKMSFEKLVYDTEKWDKEVSILTGATDLYIYPFGDIVSSGDKKFKYLQSSGFNIFFGVGNNSLYWDKGDYIFLQRIHIDGALFKSFLNKKFPLFEIKSVADWSFR